MPASPCCAPASAEHLRLPPRLPPHAVGVDNMFILAHALEQQPADHPVHHRLGLALAGGWAGGWVEGSELRGRGCPCAPAALPPRCSWHTPAVHHPRPGPPPRPPRPPRAAVGPSITLAAACEVAAFALGGLTSMPALQAFSLTAAAAVGLDFVLQVTAFVALLALDTARREG